MRELISFFVIFCLISGFNCFDWKVIGDAIVTEAVPKHSNSEKVVTLTELENGGYAEDEEQVSSDKLPTGRNGHSSDVSDTLTQPGVPKALSNNSDFQLVSYPWLASIFLKRSQICTGTLVDVGHVLTTAYCLYNLTAEDLSDLEVDIGFKASPISKFRALELTRGPYSTHKVQKSVRHLRFNPTTAYNDIGLLQLASLVQISEENPNPTIALANTIGEDSDDQKHHIIGWREGIDLDGNETHYWRDQISQGLNLTECRNNYEDILDSQGISPGMICSGGDVDATSCRWKFGTPLVLTSSADVNSTQIGTYSWGIEAFLPTCQLNAIHSSDNSAEPESIKTRPMVFTRIASYYDWIQRNLKH